MFQSRFVLLATTALAVCLGGAAVAADLSAVPAMTRPAVDGINGAFELFGGGGDPGGIFGASGKVTIPVGTSFGTQIDATFASLDGDAFVSVADHLFWRDPAKGLVGIYGAYAHYSALDGVNAGRIAVEAEAYLDRFTLRGIAGVEFGDKGTVTTATSISEFDMKTRFVDMVDLVYYPTDDLSLFVGHRYTGGKNALALGGEFAFLNTGPTSFSAFAEARIGEDDTAAWAGIKIRFGNSTKSLIRRDREDDPVLWNPDSLYGIANSLGTRCQGAGCGEQPV